MRPVDRNELMARVRTQVKRKRYSDHLRNRLEESIEAAMIDPLTGLHNRRYMESHLRTLVADAIGSGRSLSVLMADIDHFKSVNDTYGHLVGDDVLRETAKRLLASVRSYDFVGRYGGEEFLVVLNNCNPSHALVRAEEIRKAIALRPVPTSRGPIPVTMSLGLLLNQEWGRRPVEELLHEADAALYAAKAAGRNCVKIASPNLQTADAGLQTHVPVQVRR